MIIPNEVFELIQEEQIRQNGKFVPEGDVYFSKLSENAELLVHGCPGSCAGFVFFYCNNPDKISSYISLIMTAPHARRLGIATALVEYVLHISKKRNFKYCELEVQKKNISAISLYENVGFKLRDDRGEKYLMCAEVI